MSISGLLNTLLSVFAVFLKFDFSDRIVKIIESSEEL